MEVLNISRLKLEQVKRDQSQEKALPCRRTVLLPVGTATHSTSPREGEQGVSGYWARCSFSELSSSEGQGENEHRHWQVRRSLTPVGLKFQQRDLLRIKPQAEV